MSEEIEYIEPTQEHVGQMVEVRDVEHVGWTEAMLTGLLQDDFRFAAKCSGDKYSIGWRFARIPRPLTYAERQAKCGLKVGDRVRIRTLPESGQDGWKNGVSGCLRHLVGMVYPITHDCKEYGFTVAGWNFPYFVLEKVEDRVATRRDIDAVVYVDGNPQDVFIFEHWYSCDNQPCRAVVRSGDRRFVYELSNLRVKE